MTSNSPGIFPPFPATRTALVCAAALLAIACPAAFAQESTAAHPAVEGYKDTPLLPGGRWHVHDPERPQPAIVTPGTFPSQEAPGKPPSDAVVLFDGRDLAQWRGADGKPLAWTVENGVMMPAGGDMVTAREFGDVQVHIELATPTPPAGHGQERGNSGVFLQGLYEVQVLDSYENATYPDGQAAAIYGQYPPQVNASRPPGEWQTYDIVFTAARFAGDGTLQKPAYATVIHNGVLVQNHVAILGPTGHRILAKYTAGPATGPLRLQFHGNRVRYRSVWVRPLVGEEQR